MNSRAVAVGWLFLTIGVVVGHRLDGAGARRGAGQPEPAGDVAATTRRSSSRSLTWAVYSFAVFARRTMGWTGRRAAWLSALGFVIVLLNFLPVSYFVTTSHTFQ